MKSGVGAEIKRGKCCGVRGVHIPPLQDVVRRVIVLFRAAQLVSGIVRDDRTGQGEVSIHFRLRPRSPARSTLCGYTGLLY